jgi:hypothetical protein
MSDIPMHSKALNQLSPQELTEEIRHLAQQVPGMVDLELCGTWTDDGVDQCPVEWEEIPWLT